MRLQPLPPACLGFFFIKKTQGFIDHITHQYKESLRYYPEQKSEIKPKLETSHALARICDVVFKERTPCLKVIEEKLATIFLISTITEPTARV
jgi:hypothetical protein